MADFPHHRAQPTIFILEQNFVEIDAALSTVTLSPLEGMQMTHYDANYMKT